MSRKWMPRMNQKPFSLMFDPGSAAVFGASESSASVGARVFANMQKVGFEGRIYLVNPKRERLGDPKRCWQ